MLLKTPLGDCKLNSNFTTVDQGLAVALELLQLQFEQLGVRQESKSPAIELAQGEFTFTAPGAKTVHGFLDGWEKQNNKAISETIIQAASGIAWIHGRKLGYPAPLGVDFVSTLTASLALQGTVAASIGQVRGLDIARIDTSMAAAALTSITQYLAAATAGEEIKPVTKLDNTCSPPFVSADKVVFEIEALTPNIWINFWQILGVNNKTSEQGWKAFYQRYAHAQANLPIELAQRLAQYEFTKIQSIGEQTGMAVCQQSSLDQAQINANGELPWTFSRIQQSAMVRKAVPECDANLPLSGLTVVECCRRIQGPLAGHLLSLLGAEVIRIEPLGLDPLRGIPPVIDGCSARFDALNGGKQVLELDIKSIAGREKIYELVSTADVFIHNLAPGKAEQLNLSYAELEKINSQLVYSYASGWGDKPHMNHIPGTDFMVQAYSGLAHKISQVSKQPGGSLFTVLDVLGGVIASQGIVVGLLRRCIDGLGVRVDSSLLTSAGMLTEKTKSDVAKLKDDQLIFKQAVKEIFPTKDNSIAIDCSDEKSLRKLFSCLNLALDTEPKNVHFSIKEILSTKPANEWLVDFEAQKIPAALAAENLSDLEHEQAFNSKLSFKGYTRVMSPWRFK